MALSSLWSIAKKYGCDPHSQVGDVVENTPQIGVSEGDYIFCKFNSTH